MKKIALLIISNLILFEILSIGLVYAIGVVRPNMRLDLFIRDNFSAIDMEYFKRAIQNRSELLGWDSIPGDEGTYVNSAGNNWTSSYRSDGSRNDSLHTTHPYIAAYGDSFVHSHEVNDNETWPYLLEKLMGRDVRNYGIGGYGVVQTYLKLKQHLDQNKVAKITIFGIYESDLNRAVNNFRPFLYRQAKSKLGFKPSYRYIDGEITYLPNPWNDSTLTIKQLETLAFRSAETDYWVSEQHLLVPKFPYLLQSIQAFRNIKKKLVNKIKGVEGNSLWETEEGKFIMKHLIIQFAIATRAKGSYPVVLFIPNVNSEWDSGRRPLPKYYEFKTKILEKEFKDLIILDAYDAEFDESKFNIRPFRGHASVYGNKILANFIATQIKISFNMK